MDHYLRNCSIPLLLFILLNVLAIRPCLAYETPLDVSLAETSAGGVWERHIVSTAKQTMATKPRQILVFTVLATTLAHQWDTDVQKDNQREGWLDSGTAQTLNRMGDGYIEAAVLIPQLVWDTENGLRHGRALMFASGSFVLLKLVTQRTRPNSTDSPAYNSSFPSGHTAAAFATAGSIYFAYGPKWGLPAIVTATSIGLARISVNKHWLSDVVAGAGLGLFWAAASHSVDGDLEASGTDPNKTASQWFVWPHPDQPMLTYQSSF